MTDKEYRYSELSSLIQRVAGHLYHVAGVRKGEVMCMCLPNCLESTLLLVAGPSIGAVITGCNPAYTTGKLICIMYLYNDESLHYTYDFFS